MMLSKIPFMRIIGFCLLYFNVNATQATESHWSYSGEEGPGHWASLSPEYNECSGKNQSPINLHHFIEANLENIKFEYAPGGSQIVNNGHSVQINYDKGSDIILDEEVFKLKQFHFHAPSENWIDGVSYPMEGHFVHADKDGNLAVVAVMFSQGKDNAALTKLWQAMPYHTGEKHYLPALFNADELLPKDKTYYRFNGSLTTPPCSEGVRWIVLKHPVPASTQQITQFEKVMKAPNNRPIQQLNARAVLK